MKDYKDIIKAVSESVEQITDPHLKEVAFQRLLEDALGGAESGHHGKTPHATSSVSDEPQTRKPTTREPFREGSIREVIKKAFEEVDPNLPGMKPFKTFKQKWQQYLWVLDFGRRKKIDVMTNGEIAYVLSDVLSIGATEKQVNNLGPKIKDGYVQRRMVGSTKAWKILNSGITLISEAQHEKDTGTAS